MSDDDGDIYVDDFDQTIIVEQGGFDAWDVGVAFGIGGALLDGQARRIVDGINEGQRELLEEQRRRAELEQPVTINAADDHDSLTWDEFIGQENLKRQLRVHIESAKARGVALEHTLLASGRPGVGKTEMAKIIAKEMGTRFFMMVPPFHRDALTDAVCELYDGDILFIDEIHKLADHGKAQAENLLHIMEERAIYAPYGRIQLSDITVIGATTDADKLPETIIDRFPIKPSYEEYSYEDLLYICGRFERANDLFIPMNLRGTIASASRQTPRVIRELVIAVRDLLAAERPKYGEDWWPTGQELLDFKNLTPEGLTVTHRDYITGIYRAFGRTTKEGERIYVAGEMSLVTMMRMPKQGLARLERELIELGYVDRTPQGRKLTPKGVAAARKWSSS